MAAISGTCTGMDIVLTTTSGNGARKTALLMYDFAAYTASTDTLIIEDVDGEIEGRMRNGKTVTLRDCGSGPAALIGTTEYHCASTVVNSAALEFDLYATVAGTEHASATLGTFNRPGSIYVAYVES